MTLTDRHDTEKAGVKYIHDTARSSDDDFTDQVEESVFSPQEEKDIIRRIDLRITFVCGAMYFISLLDRTNLGAANIAE